MCDNLRKFFEDKNQRVKKLVRPPLIVKWMSTPGMEPVVNIIDRKVEYLFENANKGGIGKLKQWFLSDDNDFFTITAERYIVDYLKSKNLDLFDNLSKAGIDCEITAKDIGVEVTSLNSFIHDWIFSERLTWDLAVAGVLKEKTLRIKYDIDTIDNIWNRSVPRFYEYIAAVRNNIVNENSQELSRLNIEIEKEYKWAGQIAWLPKSEDSLNWFKMMTSRLFENITHGNKLKQFSKQSKNLVFVGVNNVSQTNWAIPSIFDEIGRGGNSYKKEIIEIERFWHESLRDHENITGVCYFTLSLDKINPFYPLRIFWRDENDILDINT